MLTAEQKEFLLPRAYNAALRAGKVIMDIYTGHRDFDVDMKSDNTPITIADRESHDLIKAYLAKTLVPVLSEEGREMLYSERQSWDMFWIVDPLDGTKEFIKGNNEFTVNIALIVDGRPELAVVYVPYIRKLYYSERGEGSVVIEQVAPDAAADIAYADLKAMGRKLPLHPRCNAPIRIAVSRSHNTYETYAYINRIKAEYPDAEIVEQGSSYKFCMLAEGVVECYVRTTDTYEWDTAAGELILEEAGGRTLSLPGREDFSYNKESLVNPHYYSMSPHFLDGPALDTL